MNILLSVGQSVGLIYPTIKKAPRLSRKCLKLLARPAGLEPASHGLEGRWSFANPAEFLYYLTHIFL